MQRFFSSSDNVGDGKITLSDKGQTHHLKNVLRLKLKEEVVVFDQQGNEYLCYVGALSDKVVLHIKSRKLFSGPESKVKLTIACAIPKKSKFGDIVDKLTQLGVDKIIPLETSRTVVRTHKDRKFLQQNRWEKIALNASQQSQRKNLPAIDSVKTIKEVLSKAQEYDLKLIPALIGKRQTLRDAFKIAPAKNILVLVGPEGDFTPQEIDAAVKAGFILVTLGDLVLRVETAAIAVASFVTLSYAG